MQATKEHPEKGTLAAPCSSGLCFQLGEKGIEARKV